MFVQDLVHRAAWEFGEAPAILEGARTITFKEFEERTNRLANALLDRGLRPGDRVAVVLPNCVEELLVYCALPRAGLLNARDSAADQAFKIADSGSGTARSPSSPCRPTRTWASSRPSCSARCSTA